MQGDPRFSRKGREELLAEFRVKIADLLRWDLQFRVEACPSGDIQRTEDQGLIHREQHASVTPDPPQVAQRLAHRAPEADADVFGRVVVVHVRVAAAAKLQIKAAVSGKQCQHVVEKTAAAVDSVLTAAVQIQSETDPGFSRVSLCFCSSHPSLSSSIDFVSRRSASICSLVPTVIRT